MYSWQRRAKLQELPDVPVTREEFDQLEQQVTRITQKLEDYIRQNGKE